MTLLTTDTAALSPLTVLRELVPDRPLALWEARRVIERQTGHLLRLGGIAGPPIPVEQAATVLRRVSIRRVQGMTDSGSTRWTGSQWAIEVAADESAVRQRFSLAHELAHVVWHPTATVALPALTHCDAARRLELSCDYFAACLLMPRTWVRRAYYAEGIQDVPSLARLFRVSWVALRIRLQELALDPDPRSAP